MLKNKASTLGISTQQFATFNEQLYCNPDLPQDEFHLPEDMSAAKITTDEVKTVIDSHFKANKSTGLSTMPTQCIKWLSSAAYPTIAEFLNNSAIE
jgi:hypothetical protein